MKNEKAKDRRLWEDLGWELASLRELILRICVDHDYQDIMDSRKWDKMGKLLFFLDAVRSSAESRMAKFIPDWDTDIFYPRDHITGNIAVKIFRDQMDRKNEKELFGDGTIITEERQ